MSLVDRGSVTLTETATDLPLAETADAGSGARSHRIERGTVLGRYIVLDRLGAGGMGEVFSAYDPDLDRKIALKLVKPGRGDIAGRARLLREAQAMARLTHPNVIAVHDVGTFGGEVFVAMEFIRGQTLSGWLQGAPRSWREVVGVFIMVGHGLAAAHAAGIVHRDLKPDNIMFGDDGRVRVMDFGLARARNERSGAHASGLGADAEATRTGALLGTPAYMAPEQWEGRRDVDARTDVFAFCVALWEALFGSRPFRGETLAALMVAVTQGRRDEPDTAGDVPPRVRRIVERGLAVAREDRWASMAALIDALTAANVGDDHAADLRVGARVRALAAGFFFSVTTVVNLVLIPRLDAAPSVAELLVMSYVVLCLLVGASAVLWRRIRSSAVNRTIARTAVVAVMAMIAHRHVALVLGYVPAEVVAVDLILFGAVGICGMSAISLRAAAPNALPLVAVFPALIWPERAVHVMALTFWLIAASVWLFLSPRTRGIDGGAGPGRGRARTPRP